jgi:hypothetical protein
VFAINVFEDARLVYAEGRFCIVGQALAAPKQLRH